MAKRAQQNITQSTTDTFLKGLNKDSDPSFVTDGMWTHARNAVNNDAEGDIGTISNESANYLCASVAESITNGKKVIVGAIHLYSDKWVIYTAVHVPNQIESINSEIGLFEEDRCKYRPIVQDPCLNFSELDLITGASREKEDCSWAVYWADSLNPDRYLNIGDPQTWPSDDYTWTGNNSYINSDGDQIQWPGVAWVQLCTDSTGTSETSPGTWPSGHPEGCITCVNTKNLDCDKIRLARLVNTPCLHVEPGKAGGTLLNGSYMATIAYAIKGQKVTDWFSLSNVQPIWFQNEPQGALEITVNADQENFDEFILVVISNINQGAVARQIGIYSTSTNKIYIDQIKVDLPSIPIEQLPIQTPVFETSDQIVETNNYLLRVGPRSKFDFNYQPLANLIKTNWVSVEYNEDYYVKGGYKPSYLRDEVYSFFIRWIYNTGDKSSTYHIPGRPAGAYTTPLGLSVGETQPLTDFNTLFTDPTEQERVFEIYNTASITSLGGDILDDGGVVVGRGRMAYWESTEKYPDNQEEIWNSSAHCWTGSTNPNYDLCGQYIRHHKMPDQTTHTSVYHHIQDPNDAGKNKIRILGVEFENIIYPKDNEGNDIPGVVGYEILRGSREGNTTIIAKGMINNLRPYNVRGNNTLNRRGLYPNYPFNTIIPANPAENDGPLNTVAANLYDPNNTVNDPYVIVTDGGDDRVNVRLNSVPKNITTFHSPDTNFKNPFLSTVELKLYGSISGISEQYFLEPEGHPKNKLIGNLVLLAAFLGGAIEAIISLIGKRTYNLPDPIPTVAYPLGGAAVAAAQQTYNLALLGYYSSVGPISDALLSLVSPVPNPILTGFEETYTGAMNVGSAAGVIGPYGREWATELPEQYYLPVGLRNAGLLQRMIYYFSEGADLTIRTIYALLPYRQYALQMQAHGLYDTFIKHRSNTIQRFKIDESFYLENVIQDMPPYLEGANPVNYRINNLKRQNSVVLRTLNGTGSNDGPQYLLDSIRDLSLVTIGTGRGTNLGTGVNTSINFTEDGKTNIFNAAITSHYGGIKYRIRNQYGQLDSIKQIPITPCEQTQDKTIVVGNFCGIGLTHKKIQRTGIFFNGDTYINRYTEKNNMFFFQDWLYGQPDGYENNYLLKQMIPRPRFWMNSEKYEISELSNPFNWFTPPAAGTGPFPTRYYKLDNENYNYSNDDPGNYPGILGVKESYFYLACSSVRDFFVESSVIVDFRESGIPVYEKHYDPYRYTDLETLFEMNPDTITLGNYYRYDYSLSISKIFTQYFSQGNLQSRYYNPNVAKLCYTYYPDRIIYSLPQQDESLKDSWFIYLANNYKEFKDQISGVKNFAKTGIFITFKNSSPLVFQGVDQLQTEFGTKITIGDGGLFAQTPQNVTVSDKPYEYGSSQNIRSVISSPAGLYYISQNQGKVFSFSGALSEISQNGLKWWFTLFLPYKLIQDFPDYPHVDNPVAGIGCQSIYDNRNSILYFTKKDYQLKDNYKGRVTYDESRNDFIIDGIARFKLNDPDNPAFKSASWTVSYDPKNKFWISFHDWHPDLLIPGKETFLSTKLNGIWKHNDTCTNFCNYYGVNYPFEVEVPVSQGQTISTLKSIEYILECYRRQLNCVDQYHVLDYNFDKAVIYNTEQTSGYLNLNIYPKNNVALSLQYPQVNINSIDILFSKEENKYRFNQFWDITKDRGEFPIGSDYPPTGPVIPGTTVLDGPIDQQVMWITDPNGYTRELNSNNLNYSKSELQRKKFRHYLNFLVLSKAVSNDTNMILKIVNTKNTYSPR